MAGRSTSSMGCGCGTVATLTAVTTTLRCPGDDDVCSFSTSGSTWHPEHTTCRLLMAPGLCLCACPMQLAMLHQT